MLRDFLGIGACSHSCLRTACITCGRTPARHVGSCLCQDFRDNVCAWCNMMAVMR